ncbi:MAG: HAF repeat-containing protein [Candidatus Kapabacteria bacterium]|nr:HAF repeat-containing protein [Candidatus Kapabacteria bacterium]
MKVVFAIVFAVVSTLAASAQPLVWLGTMGGVESKALGLSADGSILVGRIVDGGGKRRAFLWSADRGPQLIHELQTMGESTARGISADGKVIVGAAVDENGFAQAFRLNEGRLYNLGTLGGANSFATAASANGAVVVGAATNSSGLWRAFRWTQTTGIHDLGTFGGAESHAYAVSANGSVVVGKAHSEVGEWRAFRWRVTGQVEDLGTLGGTWAEAFGVSADGEVVVGWAEHPDGSMGAFRWTALEGMRDLGTLGGAQSKALAASADGSIVVGWSDIPTAGRRHAFRWSISRGLENLNASYAHLLTDGSEFFEARALTPDGRYIAGWGYNAATGLVEAFLLDTKEGSSTAELLSKSSWGLVRVHNDELHISNPAAAPLRAEVMTHHGQIVARYEVQNPGTHVLRLPQIAAGLYFLRMQAGTLTAVEPIVIMR